jgi:acetyltransferase-like isoleucine patch superfamily enzyme
MRSRRPRDPRQVPLRRFLAPSSLRWAWRHRAFTAYHLIRYWRFLRLRLRHPDIVTEGMVYLGRNVEMTARKGYGRIVLGRWVHLGDGNRLRAHEGTLRIGDKTVFGRENTVNCYLDVHVGAQCIVADWVYVCDFDHRTDDVTVPIKDQGIVKTPVHIGDDVWLGVKSSVLRGAQVGEGTVVAAHAVVRGEVPAYSVVAGVPGRVVRDRRAAYELAAAERAALDEMSRKARAITAVARTR